MLEKTLAIIKPDGVARRLTGTLLQRIEAAGFSVVAIQMQQLSAASAAEFYAAHQKRPFFGELVASMRQGPVVVLVLKADRAVERFRLLIGATDPANANPGSLRADYGISLSENTIHGSDSVEAAQREIRHFFPQGLVP